ncbi:hypothetical protein HAX54_031678 [Datura stramonium]|uniref:Uncharacterized protein n=1 Tax=Datura stramonium TaxID=4076 RepID=A0ABS8VBV2_DATST|nr:hypothetical protein [Datura stramonium]
MVYRRRGLLVKVVRGKWGGAGTVVAVLRVTGGGEEFRQWLVWKSGKRGEEGAPVAGHSVAWPGIQRVSWRAEGDERLRLVFRHTSGVAGYPRLRLG